MNKIEIFENKKQKLIERILNSKDVMLKDALKEASYFAMKEIKPETADSLFQIYLQRRNSKELSDDLYKLVTGARGIDEIGTITKMPEKRHKILYAKIAEYIDRMGFGEYNYNKAA